MRVMSLCRVSLLGWLSIFLAACSGCDGKEPEQQPQKPVAGVHIRLGVPANQGFPEAWELLIAEWSEQTAATAELVEYSVPAESESIVDRLKPAEGQAPALFVVPLSRSAELADAELLQTLADDPAELDQFAWKELFEGLRDHVGMIDRKSRIVPFSSPVLVCYARRDLLDKAGRKPPETWEEYSELVAKLGEWAPGLTAVEPWSAEFRSTMAFARAAAHAKHPENYSLFLDITTGAPLIDSAGFVTAMEAAKRDLARMPKEVSGYSPADCRREFLTGKAALAIAFETTGDEEITRAQGVEAAIAKLPGAQQVYNLSSAAWNELPDGGANHVTLTAFEGWGLGLSASASPTELSAARSFLARLTSDAGASFPPSAVSFCGPAQRELIEARLSSRLTPNESRQYLDAVEQSLNNTHVVADLPLVGRAQLRAALSEELGRMLDGSAEPAAALKSASERWQTIQNELGKDRVLNSYRQMLGLSKLPASK